MADNRKRYFHGAVDVSTLYPNEPRGDARLDGPLPMIEAAPVYDLTIITPPFEGTDPFYVGWFPPFVWWATDAVAVVSPAAAGSISMILDESVPGAADSVPILAAASVAAAARLTGTANLILRTAPRLLRIVGTGVTPGAVVKLTMTVHPVVPKWV